MIFALGFLLAGLLALLFMPVLSRRAVRLASRRLSMLVPLSMAEVSADRDGLRAEHAVAARRLEGTIDRLTRDKADAMAEAGRNAVRASASEAERDALASRAATLQDERDRAARDAHEAEAQFGLQVQGLHETVGLAERRLALLNTAQAQLAASQAQSDERRLTIAGLETRATGQDLRLRGLTGQVATLSRDLQDARTALESTVREREVARAEVALLTAKGDVTRAEVDAFAVEIASLRARFAERPFEEEGLRPGGPGDLAALRRTIVALGADIVRAGREKESGDPSRG